jgi:hypothetical protein
VKTIPKTNVINDGYLFAEVRKKPIEENEFHEEFWKSKFRK